MKTPCFTFFSLICLWTFFCLSILRTVYIHKEHLHFFHLLMSTCTIIGNILLNYPIICLFHLTTFRVLVYCIILSTARWVYMFTLSHFERGVSAGSYFIVFFIFFWIFLFLDFFFFWVFSFGSSQGLYIYSASPAAKWWGWVYAVEALGSVVDTV